VTCENQAFFFSPPLANIFLLAHRFLDFSHSFFSPPQKQQISFFVRWTEGFFPPSHIFSVFFHFTSPISLLLNRFLKKFLERYKEEENYQLLTFDTNQVGKSPAEKMKNMSHFF